MTYHWHGIDQETGFDYDEEREVLAIEALQEDETVSDEVGRKLIADNRDTLMELFGGAYTREQAAEVGRQLFDRAQAEWHRQAMWAIDAQNESAALSRAGC